jgi:GH25 family lysozyme M1 (1,4-beta-N-acetylmuramidase)
MIAFLCALLGVFGALAAVPAQAATSITGPDVAVYQHPNGAAIDWRAVRNDGRSFTFIKSTEGTTYTNPYFASDWKAAGAAGLYRGSYHYARPSATAGSAKAQADYFASALGDLSLPGTLPPVLDLENNGQLSVAALRTWVSTFLSEVQARTQRVPMIYTYPSFWNNQMGASTDFHQYPLWIAHYTTGSPNIIGWPRYTFWQYTSTATVGGITTTGHTDLSTFNGTALDLAALARAGTWGLATKTVADSSPSPTTTCGGYVAVTPRRILDTRTDGSGPVASSRSVTLSTDIPIGAQGVQLDITAVEPKGRGYLRVAATGATPATTALTYAPGLSTTGLAITQADASNSITVSVFGDAVDLVVDEVGYFATGTGAQWTPQQPVRVGDTRTGQGLPAGRTSGALDLDLSSYIPSTATGLILDVTAVDPTGNGYIRLAAKGAVPTATVLNYDGGGATTGLTATQATAGVVTINVYGAATHLVVDLIGWFDSAVSDASSYCPISPTRLLDTRTGLGATGPGTGPLGVAVPGSIPSDAVAVLIDVSGVSPANKGFVRLTTTGVPADTTALNLVPGRSVTGVAIVPLVDGELVASAYGATTHLVIDVLGYLGPATLPPSPSPSPSATPTA